MDGKKVPAGALHFQKLWLLPDQMYHDVPDVRTADDAVLTIRLMMFFELVDIETMLSTTHDPIPDLRILNLHSTRIEDAGLTFLEPMKGLVCLDLSDTRVTSIGPKHLEKFLISTTLRGAIKVCRLLLPSRSFENWVCIEHV